VNPEFAPEGGGGKHTERLVRGASFLGADATRSEAEKVLVAGRNRPLLPLAEHEKYAPDPEGKSRQCRPGEARKSPPAWVEKRERGGKMGRWEGLNDAGIKFI